MRTSSKVILAASLCVVGPSIAPPAIDYGQTLLGTIQCLQAETWTFDGLAGDVIVIHATECADFGGVCGGHACCCFEVCLELIGPAGTIAANCPPAENNSCGHRLRTKLGPVLLTQDGQYTIRAFDGTPDGRGSYSLFLQRTWQPGLAEVIASGDTKLKVLNTCGEVQSFTFDGHKDQVAKLSMIKDVGSVVPRLELYNPFGDPVALPGTGIIETTLPVTGEYTVLAFSAVNTLGNYFLSLDLESSDVLNYCSAAPNSAGPGATMTVGGTVSITENDLTLLAVRCPVERTGLFFFGDVQGEVPFGDGFLCVMGNTHRLPPVNTGPRGVGAFAMDYPSMAGQIVAGMTWNFQFWYRDPVFGMAGFNFSDAIAITFAP